MITKQNILKKRKAPISLNAQLNETIEHTIIEPKYQPKQLSLLPFIIFLFGSAWYFPKFVHGGVVLSNAQDISIFRQMFFGVSYLLAAASIFRNIHLVKQILIQQWLQVVLLLLVIGTVLWSVAPGKVLINFGHLSGSFIVAVTIGYNIFNGSLRFFRALCLFEFITLGVSILLALIEPAYGQMLIGDTVRWVGVTTQPNQLGIFGAIGVWSALALYHVSLTVRDKVLALLVLVAGLTTIIGADSVTSFIVAVTMLGWFLFTGRDVKLRPVMLRLMIVIFGVITLLLVVYVFKPELIGLKTLFGVAGRSENFTGRTELWLVSWHAIETRPLFGWGFDSLHSLGAKFGIAYGQFHNGYLDLLVRGGVLALSVVLVILFRGIRAGFLCWSTFPKIAIAGLGMCLFSIIHNIAEASLVRTTNPLWVLLLGAIIALDLCYNNSKRKNIMQSDTDA